MSGNDVAPTSAWTDAALAAAAFAIDSRCGVVIKACPGPVRDRWLALVRSLLPAAAPVRRVPLHATDGRLLGGLDLAATLQAGRPVVERGILAEADGGTVVLAMAERMTLLAAARLAAVLDNQEIVLERDGLTVRMPAHVGVIALDEGIGDEERPPGAVLDRTAFHVDLGGVALKDTEGRLHDSDEIASARVRLPRVQASFDSVKALCGTALALGITSIRVSVLVLHAARALAALAGRSHVAADDAISAARLVLAPRARVLPAGEPAREYESDDGPLSDERRPEDADIDVPTSAHDRDLDDIVLAAARATIPADLLAQLQLGSAVRPPAMSQGHAGVARFSARRGRPVGARSGELRTGARLDVIETLRAAAPWQPLRRASHDNQSLRKSEQSVIVRREDFRVMRFKQRTGTTTIFAVDASGSSALHRLAEVKGAVELLLAECYVRRDQVALLAFRGRGADLLLPATRSLVRAKRSLAGLPGGGGTPLAAGIDAAAALAEAVWRRGQTPVVIFMTDGRANVAADGSTNRSRAQGDALTSARRLRAAGITAMLIDTSMHTEPLAARVAAEMDAQYLALPHADAIGLSRAVFSIAALRPHGGVRQP